MRKIVLLLFVCAMSMTDQAQIVVSSKFKPRSFDEYVAPLTMYRDAYNAAVEQFNEYYEKEQIELAKFENQEQYSPSLGLFYIKKCIEINNRFNGAIFNGGSLYTLKGVWHLLNDERDEALHSFKYAWEKYKHEVAREWYNELITE